MTTGGSAARLRVGLLGLAMVSGLVGCGPEPATDPTVPVVTPSSSVDPSPEDDRAAGGSMDDAPPEVTVTAGGQPVDLQPWAYCWHSPLGSLVCADGLPPVPLPDLGTVSGDVAVAFPGDDWSSRLGPL